MIIKIKIKIEGNNIRLSFDDYSLKYKAYNDKNILLSNNSYFFLEPFERKDYLEYLKEQFLSENYILTPNI